MKKFVSLFLIFCILFLNTQFCYAEELSRKSLKPCKGETKIKNMSEKEQRKL